MSSTENFDISWCLSKVSTHIKVYSHIDINRATCPWIARNGAIQTTLDFKINYYAAYLKYVRQWENQVRLWKTTINTHGAQNFKILHQMSLYIIACSYKFVSH